MSVPESIPQLEDYFTSKASGSQRRPLLANDGGSAHDEFVQPAALTYTAAAGALSVSRRTIGRMVQRGQLNPVSIGGTKRIPVSQVRRLTAA